MRSIYGQWDDDPERWEDFRDRMVGEFPNTPVVVSVMGPHNGVFHGPFANGKEACEWIATQTPRGRIRIIPQSKPSGN